MSRTLAKGFVKRGHFTFHFYIYISFHVLMLLRKVTKQQYSKQRVINTSHIFNWWLIAKVSKHYTALSLVQTCKVWCQRRRILMLSFSSVGQTIVQILHVNNTENQLSTVCKRSSSSKISFSFISSHNFKILKNKTKIQTTQTTFKYIL